MGYGVYYLKKSKSNSDKRHPSKSRKVKKISSKDILEKEKLIRQLVLIKREQELESQKLYINNIKINAVECPNCGNTILKREEKLCAICGFKLKEMEE